MFATRCHCYLLRYEIFDLEISHFLSTGTFISFMISTSKINPLQTTPRPDLRLNFTQTFCNGLIGLFMLTLGFQHRYKMKYKEPSNLIDLKYFSLQKMFSSSTGPNCLKFKGPKRNWRKGKIS